MSDAEATPEGISHLFQDGKDSGALRTIGEVAAALGLKQHVLRYWEEQFPMLRPLTRAGGRRYYRPEDIALIVRINRLLHSEGYTIRGARQALQGGGVDGERARPAIPAPVLDASAPEEERIIAALHLLRAHLEAVRDRLAVAVEAA